MGTRNLEVRTATLQRTVQIYDTSKGQSADGKTRYTTSFLITDLGLKECRVHFIQGRLDHEINTLILKLLQGLGYVMAQWEVPEGTDSSRFSKKIRTRDGLDRYEVDLTLGE